MVSNCGGSDNNHIFRVFDPAEADSGPAEYRALTLPPIAVAVAIIITPNVSMRRRPAASAPVMASAVMPTKYKMCNSMVISLKICLAG
ncbi:Uncharacterised protein [Escherichia coli]|uniref:Uncharacterized protein n=1 Tax=Escherichia coli TaxID=562 RepID=A0A376ML42_ECOLX|nr:Uncharacterised protein [Escherichia coli]